MMDGKKTIMVFVALLSISQGASGASVEVRTIDTALQGMHSAASQSNIQTFEQHKKQFLDLVRRNPDMLWHKERWGRLDRNVYLIDAALRFGLAIQAHCNEIVESMKHTYRICLLLSCKTILGPSAEQSYLAQLVDDVVSNSMGTVGRIFIMPDYAIKLELALEYLVHARQQKAYIDAKKDTVPSDVNQLLMSFVHGVQPRLQKRFVREASQLEMRQTSNEKNEFDAFREMFIRRIAMVRESHLNRPDCSAYRLLRCFSHAGLMRGMETERTFRQRKIAQGINNTRLTFEEGMDDLPDVIAIPSIAQANNLELE